MTAATTTAGPQSLPAPRDSYLTQERGWRSWAFTHDHKRIAIMYLAAIIVALLLGGLFALVLRLHLWAPEKQLLSNDVYNHMFTLHGAVMIFLFIIPGIPAVMGNFVIPLQLGAKDLAFPRVNLLSLYLYVIGMVLFLVVLVTGGLDTGWTLYPPYSLEEGHDTGLLAALTGAFVVGFSSILTGVNFIATIHHMRPKDMGWFDMPLYLWSSYATSIIQIIATPVVGITLAMALVEHVFHVGIFLPKYGGDPVLFQHFFWFYSHPVVYVMLLPAMGIVSEVVSVFTRKHIFGYTFIAFSSMAIALVGFLVWGHHLFVSGQSKWSNIIFSALTFLVAVPSAIKVFNWVTTMYKGTIILKAPMLYVLSFLMLFGVGGLTGLFLASLATDVPLHDTYFVVAHFHFVMVGSVLSAFMAGLHYWWPKMFGRMYDERPARVACLMVFVGFLLTFVPQFIAGLQGMPRRYAQLPIEFALNNKVSSVGALILAGGMFLTLRYLIDSLRHGELAPPNPWGGATLEWATYSPPVTHNFEQDLPPITGPYNYKVLQKISDDTGYVRNDGWNLR